MLISEAFDTVGMHPKILRLGESTGRYALMQYTGLKDKNGVEIYEGDVICMRYPNSYCSKYGHADEVVIYEDGHYPVFFSDGGETFDDPSKLTEVIGNIYENPELLKWTH